LIASYGLTSEKGYFYMMQNLKATAIRISFETSGDVLIEDLANKLNDEELLRLAELVIEHPEIIDDFWQVH
jgi:hypothetical protein